jgi:hypothetical protein
MNWWEWVFSGIGVLIIGFFLERWRRSSQRKAILTAQGAKVTNSPVASGSGIIQTVNSPVVTVNLGQTLEPALPKLSLELREVCFDDFLASAMYRGLLRSKLSR